MSSNNRTTVPNNSGPDIRDIEKMFRKRDGLPNPDIANEITNTVNTILSEQPKQPSHNTTQNTAQKEQQPITTEEKIKLIKILARALVKSLKKNTKRIAYNTMYDVKELAKKIKKEPAKFLVECALVISLGTPVTALTVKSTEEIITTLEQNDALEKAKNDAKTTINTYGLENLNINKFDFEKLYFIKGIVTQQEFMNFLHNLGWTSWEEYFAAQCEHFLGRTINPNDPETYSQTLHNLEAIVATLMKENLDLFLPNVGNAPGRGV